MFMKFSDFHEIQYFFILFASFDFKTTGFMKIMKFSCFMEFSGKIMEIAESCDFHGNGPPKSSPTPYAYKGKSPGGEKYEKC